MTSQDIEYYRKRAATERALALATRQSDIASIHLQLARSYEALLEPRARPKPRIGWGNLPQA